MARVVGRRYIPLVVSVPAGTAENAPQSTDVDLGQVNLDAVHLIIPTGHVGLTGIAIEVASKRVLPWSDSATDWVKGNGLRETFDVGLEVGRGVVVKAFNTDVYDHGFHLRFEVTDIIDERPAAPLRAVVL